MKRISVVAALALGACEATVPMATPAEEVAGRQFSAPRSGEAAVYVYRADRPQPVVFGVTAGRLNLGELGTNTWLRADLPPGQTDLRCTGGREATPSLLIDLQPGQTRYVELTTEKWRLACNLAEMPPATAQPAILAGKRAREISGASD